MAKKRRVWTSISVLPMTEGGQDTPKELDGVTWVVDPVWVAKLNEEFDTLRRVENEDIRNQLDPSKIRGVRLNDIAVAVGQTAIPHGLGRTPHFYYVIPKAAATWHETKAPDEQYLYLEASAPITADIIVEG